MKYKIYHFSGDEPALQAAGFDQSFELVPKSDIGFEELLAQNYDVIMMAEEDYGGFAPFLPAVDWQVSQLGAADCLVRHGNYYRPTHSQADAALRVLKKNAARIDAQMPVLIVGEYYFAAALLLRLGQSGFNRLITVLVNADEVRRQSLAHMINSIMFKLDFKVIAPEELMDSQQNAALLISDVKKEKNPELYELMTYFNFLSSSACVLDCRSLGESLLTEEARKAELSVLDEIEVQKAKYNNFLETLKNSP